MGALTRENIAVMAPCAAHLLLVRRVLGLQRALPQRLRVAHLPHVALRPVRADALRRERLRNKDLGWSFTASHRRMLLCQLSLGIAARQEDTR